MIHDVFADALQVTSKYVRSFEIQSGGGRGYHLFFATNHILGLEKMKDAMWSVDPTGGFTFRDSTVLGQEVLFSKPAHTGELARELEDHFRDREFTIEEAEEADRSAIEWTDATWNPVTGCSKVRGPSACRLT